MVLVAIPESYNQITFDTLSLMVRMREYREYRLVPDRQLDHLVGEGLVAQHLVAVDVSDYLIG